MLWSFPGPFKSYFLFHSQSSCNIFIPLLKLKRRTEMYKKVLTIPAPDYSIVITNKVDGYPMLNEVSINVLVDPL